MRNPKVGNARRNCGTEIRLDELAAARGNGNESGRIYGRRNKGVAGFMIVNWYNQRKKEHPAGWKPGFPPLRKIKSSDFLLKVIA